VLEKVMLPSVKDLFHRPWLYQQDNALCNTAKKVKKWREDRDMRSLSWPRMSILVQNCTTETEIC